jgi:hypothetical protein
MNLFLSFAVMALVAGTQAQASDVNYYTLTKKTVREVTQRQTMAAPLSRDAVAIGAVDCEAAHPLVNAPIVPTTGDSANPLDAIDMIVDKIINIGKKIFAIVQAGKPVVNIRTDVATALPSGARCWTDLEGWQMPESKVYEVAFENAYGMEVVKMSYRVLWLPGGQVNDVGQYIGYATMTPVSVDVSWGFSLNAQVSIPTVFNMGSKKDPIAGMQMNMQYQIESPLTTIQEAQAYFVDGKGRYKQLD